MTKTNIEPYVGSTLPNGALVLAVGQGPGGYPVVLAVAQPGTPGAEYVTWEVNEGTKGLVAYWGHYHQLDLATAVEDFTARTTLIQG